MDDDASPYLWICIGIICILIILLAAILFLCRQALAQRLQILLHGKRNLDADGVEEEIISMVKEGHEQGVLQESEAEMIHNIFAFDDKEAKDIMTHRKNIMALPGSVSFTDAVKEMHETNRSRYPVYGEDFDHVIGVLHIKDAFAFVQRNEIFRTSIQDIPGLIRDVEFIPETMKINDLFQRMQAAQTHMVVVVDEYGQTAGIVAMEDILEEIVGNIEDEHDEREEYAVRLEDGSWMMDGLLAYSEAVELLGVETEPDSFDTLNGFLVSSLDKIPSEGEKPVVQAFGYDFFVQKIEEQVIREVHVVKTLAETSVK